MNDLIYNTVFSNYLNYLTVSLKADLTVEVNYLPEILLHDSVFTEKLRENKCLKHNKNFYKFWVLTFMKMPKISKQCEECGGSSPVACKSCKKEFLKFCCSLKRKIFPFALWILTLNTLDIRYRLWSRFLHQWKSRFSRGRYWKYPPEKVRNNYQTKMKHMN